MFQDNVNLNIEFKESLLRVQQYTIEKAPLLRVYPETQGVKIKQIFIQPWFHSSCTP